jgi:hypothetical protein
MSHTDNVELLQGIGAQCQDEAQGTGSVLIGRYLAGVAADLLCNVLSLSYVTQSFHKETMRNEYIFQKWFDKVVNKL